MDLSLLTFAVTTLVVVMTPGPTVLLALANGSQFGLGRASYGIAGAALSDLVLVAAAALGLGAVLAASATAFLIVKTLGAAYLIWLGLQMLRAARGPAPALTPAGKAPNLFRKSFLVAVTNPKGLLFMAAFLPQFLTPSEPLLPQYLALTLIFVSVDVAVMSVYAGLGAKAMRTLSDRGTLWINRTCGGLLMALGLALATLRRSAG